MVAPSRRRVRERFPPLYEPSFDRIGRTRIFVEHGFPNVSITVCPARAPAEKNVRYYKSPAQAARDGYRPCLRCRPESAPGSPACWLTNHNSYAPPARIEQINRVMLDAANS